jgi:hypothetical protein
MNKWSLPGIKKCGVSPHTPLPATPCPFGLVLVHISEVRKYEERRRNITCLYLEIFWQKIYL